jgi:hypothetical protein
MKQPKLILYIVIELMLILAARLIFINTSRLAGAASQDSATIVQNLYILQSLVLFIPFIIVLILIFKELSKINHDKKELLNQQSVQTITAENINELEQQEALRLQEEHIQKELQEKKEKLYACLEEKFAGKSAADHKKVSEKILGCIASAYEITQAEIFLKKDEKLVLSSTYAFYVPEEKVFEFEMGEGLIGQVAKAGEPLLLNELPSGYITVKSGLGQSTPSHLLIIPWKDLSEDTFAVLEIAAFKAFRKEDVLILTGLSDRIRKFYV